MPVPTDGWINGGWNRKLPQFRLLAEMLGLNKPSISPEDLQVLFRSVSSAKVFADNVQSFLEATGGSIEDVAKRLEGIEQKLGLLQPLPFMSLRGMDDPLKFSGVAIWPAGITNWTQLRLREIRTATEAGAYIDRIIVLGSSRVCNAPADKRHPLIANLTGDSSSGLEPTERGLQRILIADVPDKSRFYEAELPKANADGRPLSLEQQLKYLKESGQFAEFINDRPVYVPSTPNSLYVPLHVRRVLGLGNVWFSQAGARLVRGTPDSWWPSLQDVMTTPNGIIRLWVELLYAGCITK